MRRKRTVKTKPSAFIIFRHKRIDERARRGYNKINDITGTGNILSYYELFAEGRGYYLFQHRALRGVAAHFHSAIEFVFVERGEAEINIEGETRIVSAGNACFVDSFRVHSYRDLGSSVYVFLGDGAYFERFFRQHKGQTFPRFFPFDDFPLLGSLLDFCERTQNTDNVRTVFGGAAEILCGVLAERVALEQKREDKLSAFVCDILSYAANNAEGDLSLAALSATFGYSREHLSRILHRYLRESWNDYVNRLRVIKAECILRENKSANVLQTAYDCGFESSNTFYRAYKKEFGRSPKRT